MRITFWFLFFMLILESTAAAQQNTGIQSMDIQGSGRIGENTAGQWVASIPRAATVLNTQGYRPVAPRPNGGQLPTEWERRIEYRWNFNDGSGVLSSGDLPTITHRMRDNGSFTLNVEARTADGVIARGEKQIEVYNRPPRFLRLSATYVGPEVGKYLLSVTADDAPGDPLQFNWDFGDGTTLRNGGWEVYHTFAPGTYTIRVTASDQDGKESTKTRSLSVNSYSEVDASDVDGTEKDQDALEPGAALQFQVAGALNAKFNGTVKPFNGLHLSAIKDGKVCRFLFTAWDSTNLMNVMGLFDLNGIRENGASYTLRNPTFHVNFFKDAERYNAHRSSINNGPGAGVGSLLSIASALTGSETIKEKTGLAPGGTFTEVEPAKVAVSPFGVETTENFKTADGTIALQFVPHQRASGRIQLNLKNTREKSSLREVSINGDFAFDLARLQQNGIMLYNQCGEGSFSIVKVNPDTNPQHWSRLQPTSRVAFSSAVDPATVTDDTFQLTYPSSNAGTPVPVDVQIQRQANGALLKPKEPLFGGVTYTVRVKTGEDGVKSRAGVSLEDTDGSGWHTWTFTTEVNLEPLTTAGDEVLGCNVYQSVRDVPLIAGKPAVSRIYALWKKNPLVADSAQVKQFKAEVVLQNGPKEVATKIHTFVRPDLWKQQGIRSANAEHTANVFWTPTTDTPKRLRVALKVEQTFGGSRSANYWGACSTPMWKHAPKLKVALFLLAVNAYEDKDTREKISPTMWSIMKEAKTYLAQQFPLKEVTIEFGGVIEHPLRRRALDANTDCDFNCASNTLYTYSGDKADADIILGIVPLGAPISGGDTKQELSPEEPAYIVLGIDDKPEHFDRFVYAVAHEIGHAFWLEHLPYVKDFDERAEVVKIRDKAFSNNYSPIHWYQGIAGFRIAEEGTKGWNKSSIEGNAEADWLVPLMFPGSIPYKRAFVVRHQYLKMQHELERRSGKPRGVAVVLQ